MVYIKFEDIPQFTRSANYRVNMSWEYIETWIERQESGGLDLDPPFQRAHVWNKQQQIRYVEFILRGGCSGRDIYFNNPTWMGTFTGETVLVDGKQRLQAVRRFLHNEIPVFGTLHKDYEDKLPTLHCDFIVHVNDLKTMEKVYQWYIDLNSGGTPHTDEEIEKVRKLLKQEQKSTPAKPPVHMIKLTV